MPQGGSDLIERPVDLIGGNYQLRGNADRMFMRVLGQDASALQRFTIRRASPASG